jgi:hypothetical protein
MKIEDEIGIYQDWRLTRDTYSSEAARSKSARRNSPYSGTMSMFAPAPHICWMIY